MTVAAVNLAVRLAAAGACLTLLTVIIAGAARRPLKVALGGLLAGSIAYVIHSEPAFGLSREAHIATDLISLFTPFWTWLFARRLFEREPDRRATMAIAAVLLACWAVAYFLPQIWRLGFYGIHLSSLALMADLFRNAWLGRDDDLVERRRPIRIWLPLAIAVQAVAILGFELAFGPEKAAPQVQLANAVFILGLTMFAAVSLLRPDSDLLLEEEAVSPGSRSSPSDALSPSERVLLDKLDVAMAEGFYRTPGLGIAGLAAHLGAPEHRLRALINRRLGYRNFSAFLNFHRIAEARQVLADRTRVDLPVLTIAMDLGYISLPTFNRAFRETTGCTPTEFRREAISVEAGRS